jgi:adenylate cyclase
MTDESFDAGTDELLNYLVRRGLSFPDGGPREVLNRIGWSRVFGLDGEQLGISELADRAGLDVDDARRFLRSLGFQGEGPWDERDIAALALINDGCLVFGKDTVNHVARVIGSSTNRVAEAIADAVRIAFRQPVREESGSSYMDDVEAISAEMLPRLGAMMENLVRRHLLELVDVDWHPDADISVMVAHSVIGFADMVGFTSRSASSSVGELTKIVDRFESEVAEAVVGSGGRVVKFIGDEVMFAFRHADAACRCARALLALADAEAIPDVRIGMAMGEVVSRFGDLYGPIVNIAARLVQSAPPRSALVTRELAASAGDGTFSSFGELELRGIPVPIAVARLV